MSGISEEQVIKIDPLNFSFVVSREMLEDRIDTQDIHEIGRERFMRDADKILEHILFRIPIKVEDTSDVEGMIARLEFVVFTPEQAKILMKAWREKYKDDKEMWNMYDAGRRDHNEQL